MSMNIPKEALPNARPVAEYLAYLACPDCQSSIGFNQTSELACSACNRTFAVNGNFPILLPRSLPEPADWQKWQDMDNKYREFYRTWSKEKHLAAVPTYDAFYDWCGVKDIQKVSLLDVGGGNGTSRVMYWQYPEKIDYFNVDPQINFLHPFHLDLYPRMKEIGFPYIVGVGENLPLKSNTFDIGITTAAVDHWHSPVDVFQEILRCLKPKGSLYIMVSRHIDLTDTRSVIAGIGEYYRRYGIAALGKEVSARMLRRKKDTHMHHFRSVEELTRLLYMFQVIRTREAEEGNQLYVECRKA